MQLLLGLLDHLNDAHFALRLLDLLQLMQGVRPRDLPGRRAPGADRPSELGFPLFLLAFGSVEARLVDVFDSLDLVVEAAQQSTVVADRVECRLHALIVLEVGRESRSLDSAGVDTLNRLHLNL